MKPNPFEKFGIAIPEILLPTVPIENWSVIACDQHTSNSEYWDNVISAADGKPSSLNLMMPEAWLGLEERKVHQDNIPKYMEQYLNDGTLRNIGEGIVFIKRKQSNGKYRRGFLALLDLDKYEYTKGNKALCRATEAVVEERLPARIEIRKRALLEMPHAMVLFEDKKDVLMDQLEILTRNRKPLYDAELMLGGGNIKAWFLQSESDFKYIKASLEIMLNYANAKRDGMLFAVGDGNHSLAAAKKCGDKYILVEFVNIFDRALDFHPIHRITDSNGVVADYVHGEEEAKRIAAEKGLTAQIMPPYPKDRLFSDVIEKGSLPKKTFSMGEAQDKRYYLECRALKQSTK